MQAPTKGTEPGVRSGKCSLLACHTRCKCSMETTRNSVKVKVGIKVMKLVESLIGLVVTVGQGSQTKEGQKRNEFLLVGLENSETPSTSSV